MNKFFDSKYALRSIVTLLQQHDDYKLKRKSWLALRDMHRGSGAVLENIGKYILPKTAEEPLEYQARLANASYTPILANTFRETINKLTSAPLHMKGGDTDYWLKVRQALDGKTLDENDFIEQVFTQFLYYGVFYGLVYRPELSITPVTEADDAQILNAGYQSRLKILPPLSVIHWGDDWYLTQDIYRYSEPLEAEQMRCRWSLYAPGITWVYDVEAKTEKGQLSQIKVGNEWKSATDKDTMVVGRAVLHGLDKCPVVTLTLEPHHWAGDLAWNQQLRHLRTESQLNETGAIAGTVVRVFTPTPPKEESPATLLRPENHEGNLALKLPGTHTLVGNDYKFVESSGVAIGGLMDILEKIERYLRAVGSLDFKSADSRHSTAEAKQTDMSLLENEMMFLGAKALKVYQDVADLIARLDNQPVPVAEGLQNYGINNITVMLEQSTLLETIAPRLPTVALMLWYTRLATALAGQTFGLVEEQLQNEIEALYSKDTVTPTEPLVTTSIGANIKPI